MTNKPNLAYHSWMVSIKISKNNLVPLISVIIPFCPVLSHSCSLKWQSHSCLLWAESRHSSITDLIVTLRMTTVDIECHYAECRYAECHSYKVSCFLLLCWCVVSPVKHHWPNLIKLFYTFFDAIKTERFLVKKLIVTFFKTIKRSRYK